MLETPPPSLPRLVDRLGRVHTSLRVSVTDRCNIRCFYCMPAEQVVFRPKDELLTFEEIERFVRVVARLGVSHLRITGGEPLVRQDLPTLIRQLAGIDGLRELALTTNGMLLAEQAEALRAAGLQRVNISLDALSEAKFQKITRRPGLDRVLEGIAAAQEAGFEQVRLNAIAIRGLTEEEVVPLAEFARKRNLQLRFIEFMPLDADGKWQTDDVLSGHELRAMLEQHIGPLLPAPRDDPSQPATNYVFADGRGALGLINPVTEPFCHQCNRLRLTAEGQVRNCLFSQTEWDARALLRGGASNDELEQLVVDCVTAKRPAHGIGEVGFQQPERAMYQIGG